MGDMVLPPPAPQSELEGLQAGKPQVATPLPGVPVQSIPGDPVRLHGDMTRHPTNKQWTRNPNRKI